MTPIGGNVSPETTLDPSTPEEWSEFRGLAHRMLDDMLDHLAGLPQDFS